MRNAEDFARIAMGHIDDRPAPNKQPRMDIQSAIVLVAVTIPISCLCITALFGAAVCIHLTMR